jgi:hypothetical protein
MQASARLEIRLEDQNHFDPYMACRVSPVTPQSGNVHSSPKYPTLTATIDENRHQPEAHFVHLVTPRGSVQVSEPPLLTVPSDTEHYPFARVPELASA